MEKNIYIFIIWNKVLWAKKRILSDLSKSFEVVKVVEVEWNENKCIENLLAFYGTKTNDATDKQKAIGNGKFCLILVKDNNEEFETVHKYDRDEYVNKRINKKKKLYRNWTGTDFRIHSSENGKETIHDLIVLFGNDYSKVISNACDIIKMDTKGVEGFKDINDFSLCIKNFGDNFYINNDNYFIISRKRNDVLRFIYNYKFISNNKYLVKIGDAYKEIDIYGEEEGDLPIGFISKIESNRDFINEFSNIEKEYNLFGINNKNVIAFFNHYDLDNVLVKKETVRKKENRNLFEKLKKKIRYDIAYLNNCFYLLKNK